MTTRGLRLDERADVDAGSASFERTVRDTVPTAPKESSTVTRPVTASELEFLRDKVKRALEVWHGDYGDGWSHACAMKRILEEKPPEKIGLPLEEYDDFGAPIDDDQ